MLKKILNYLVLLVLVSSCVFGCVSAKQYDYIVEVGMGDVVKISEKNFTGYTYSDVTYAYKNSGLFNWSYDNNKKEYTFTAAKPGGETVKTNGWGWIDPNYYYFRVYVTKFNT
jgi:hypothetical protein